MIESFGLRVRQAMNQVVIGTVMGGAQPVAASLDHEGWPEVVGTVAGDDTVLVICPDPRRAGEVEARAEDDARIMTDRQSKPRSSESQVTQAPNWRGCCSAIRASRARPRSLPAASTRKMRRAAACLSPRFIPSSATTTEPAPSSSSLSPGSCSPTAASKCLFLATPHEQSREWVPRRSIAASASSI